MSSLWLPEKTRRALGLDRAYQCTLCGTEFGNRSLYIRHTTRCARANEEAIEEHLAQREANAFTGVLDREHYEWQNDVKSGKRTPMRRGVVVK